MTDRELLELIAGQVGALTKDVSELKGDVSVLKEGQNDIKKDIKSIIDQATELSEFSTMEIVTSKNWNDIAKLKAAR